MKNNYSNLIINRQEEIWSDSENDQEFPGFTYILYEGDYETDYNKEGEYWYLNSDTPQAKEIISVIHDYNYKIIHHLSLEDDDGDRWWCEYPRNETIHGPNDIDLMYNNDINKFGEDLKKICDLPKILKNYILQNKL